MRPLRLRAEWALPVDAPPIRHAALLIGADGRIASVGADPDVPTPPDGRTEDLGAAILFPGFVNTHTHLELTGFEDQAPGSLRPQSGLATTASEPAFRDWVQIIRRLKDARRREDFLDVARRGVRDCWSGGITTIADTGDSGSVIQALAELDGSGIVYQEVFGPHPSQLEASFAGLEQQVDRLARFAAGRVRMGVSPHAPYTVSGPLYAKVACWARAEGLPIAVHIAESREESEFVMRRVGPFAEAWTARGIPLLDDPAHQPSGRPAVQPSPVQWLDHHEVLGPTTLCIHAIQLTPEDIELLARRSVSIAHCPLSNARHRHGAAPLSALRRAGIRIGLGTDSVASVGRLDFFAEARAAKVLGGLTPDDALALCTLEGARALGLDREIGSLTVGKWGDVVAMPAGGPPGVPPGSPADAVLAGTPESVRLTVLAGRVVHRARAPA